MSEKDRLPIEKLKAGSLLLSNQSEEPRHRSQERFSDEKLAEIKQGFAKRFKEAFNHDSNAAIARKLGVADMTVKPYADGDRLPVGEMLFWISIKAGVSMDWLLTGKGSKRVKSGDMFSAEEESRINHLAKESNRTFDEMVHTLTMAMVEAHEKI